MYPLCPEVEDSIYYIPFMSRGRGQYIPFMSRGRGQYVPFKSRGREPYVCLEVEESMYPLRPDVELLTAGQWPF